MIQPLLFNDFYACCEKISSSSATDDQVLAEMPFFAKFIQQECNISPTHIASIKSLNDKNVRWFQLGMQLEERSKISSWKELQEVESKLKIFKISHVIFWEFIDLASCNSTMLRQMLRDHFREDGAEAYNILRPIYKKAEEASEAIKTYHQALAKRDDKLLISGMNAYLAIQEEALPFLHIFLDYRIKVAEQELEKLMVNIPAA
jgi:hypothetical protein